MSVSEQTTIWCDICNARDQANLPIELLRKELEQKGWTTVREYHVQDYCPRCSKFDSRLKNEMFNALKTILFQEREQYLKNLQGTIV